MSDGRDRESQELASTVIAATAFVVGTIGAVVFAVVYVAPDLVPGGQTQWLGGALTVAVGGIGVGLIVWAHGLMPQGPEVEEREFPAPDPSARQRLVATFERQSEAIGRRSLLGRLLLLAAGVTGVAALFPIRSLGRSPFPERTRTGWREGLRLVTETGEPVHVDDLEVNSILTVFPEGRIQEADSQAVLLRVPPDILRPLEGREDWTPQGYVAYSKLCTHAGCPVGLYEVESQRLFCPCHQSAFDVLEAAAPRFGPATRALPQLPLAVNEAGELIARGDFDKPVGPGFWTYPGAKREYRQ